MTTNGSETTSSKGPKEEITDNPNAERAWDILGNGHIDRYGADDLEKLYARHTAETRVPTVEFKTRGDHVSVMYLSELLIGNQDSDVEFYNDTIDQIMAAPEADRPDLIVLSGFLQGDYRYLGKRNRVSVIPELRKMSVQFELANALIQRAVDTGALVVYNMGDDDRRIAEEGNIQFFEMFEKHARGYVNNHKELSWSAIDSKRRHPMWQQHLDFQTDVAFPYMLRTGRTLYNYEEMRELSNGEVELEEYFILQDAADRIKRGVRLNPLHHKYLDIPALRGRVERGVSGFHVVDDVDLHITTKGRDYTDWVRHYLTFSPQPAYQNHMSGVLQNMNARIANGEFVPDMIVTQNNHEAVGLKAGHRMVVSTGGLVDVRKHMTTKGTRTNSPSISRRVHATRRRAHAPSTEIHERFDDGRHKVTLINEVLRDKSDSLPERIAIPMFCDWQTGSISARPELQMRYMDYVRTKLMGEMAVDLLVGGDMIHGRNYANFPMESQSTGLMAMDSQVAFVRELIETDLDNYTPAQVEALIGVHIQIGNHEWNSSTLKWTGYSFHQYIKDAYSGLYQRNGYTRQEAKDRVHFHDQIITPNREIMHTFSTVLYLGAYGVHLSHFLMDRGSGGSGLPVYQAHHHSVGAGSNKQSIDIDWAGHFHHGEYGLMGDKLSIINPSLAGLTGYEWRRGYRANPGAVFLELGGGEAPSLTFMTEETLMKHKVRDGVFSPERLADDGYFDDPGADDTKYTTMFPNEFPKTAAQKRLKKMMMDASERTETTGFIQPGTNRGSTQTLK